MIPLQRCVYKICQETNGQNSEKPIFPGIKVIFITVIIFQIFGIKNGAEQVEQKNVADQKDIFGKIPF
jgi:hypothetical protein